MKTFRTIIGLIWLVFIPVLISQLFLYYIISVFRNPMNESTIIFINIISVLVILYLSGWLLYLIINIIGFVKSLFYESYLRRHSEKQITSEQLAKAIREKENKDDENKV